MMYTNVYRRITVHTDLIRAFDVTPSKCLCMRSPRTIETRYGTLRRGLPVGV